MEKSKPENTLCINITRGSLLDDSLERQLRRHQDVGVTF
jgi:hypothetical protein